MQKVERLALESFVAGSLSEKNIIDLRQTTHEYVAIVEESTMIMSEDNAVIPLRRGFQFLEGKPVFYRTLRLDDPSGLDQFPYTNLQRQVLRVGGKIGYSIMVHDPTNFECRVKIELPNSTRQFHFEGYHADSRKAARTFAASEALKNRVLKFYLQEFSAIKYVQVSKLLKMTGFSWSQNSSNC